MSKPLSKAELLQKYSDKEWQDRLLDLLAIESFLRDSIIERGYKIPDELNNAIPLTDVGKRVKQELITKGKVPAKEAHLLVFLGLVHVEPLVDIGGIDLDALKAAVSSEVKNGLIRFPFVFGRDLYDRASELFPEERSYLRHDDTLKLMEGMPQGVFQAGSVISGPFGLLDAAHERSMAPTTSIPLQHCSELSCATIHNVQLTTSVEAGVNQHRPALNKALDEISVDPSEWNSYVSEISKDRMDKFDDDQPSTVVLVIGDGLDDVEISELFAYALDDTKGRLRKVAERFGFRGAALDIARGANRAQILQLLLTESDESLVRLVNDCIAAETIRIPAGERRRARVNGRKVAGSWGLRSELGAYGYRVLSRDPGLPLLRLAALARTMFSTSSAADMDDLAWLLRSVSGETPSSKLEEFIRTASPRSIVERLVLARKVNTQELCSRWHISLDQPDDELVDRILWKLGFPPVPVRDHRQDYWRLHEALEKTATTASVTLGINEEALRSIAANYFVALEKCLMDSLVYTAWALLHDHYGAEQRFVYRESAARSFSFAQFASGAGLGLDPVLLSDKSTLGDIVAGYSVLAKILEALRENPETSLRAEGLRPTFADKTPLQGFPFDHSRPFLDLTPNSQVRLLSCLRDAAAQLSASGIIAARNGLLHANRSPVDPQTLAETLNAARSVVRRLEDDGCVRMTFTLSATSIDEWDRATAVMVARDGKEISFSSPSAFEWLGLPDYGTPQFLMPGAVFALPNAMLRFKLGPESAYEIYWSGYPRRRAPGNRVVAGQSDGLSTPMETGKSFVASRAD